jgi:hypothetical protein
MKTVTQQHQRAVRAGGLLTLMLLLPALGIFSPAPARADEPQWSGWTILGGSMVGRPSVTQNWRSALELFMRGTDNAIWHVAQNQLTNPPTWGGWQSLGGILAGNPSVALNTNGQLEVFARGTDNALWHITQNPQSGTGWGPWVKLGGHMVGDPAVGKNSDGRLEVFVRDTDRTLSHIWQTSPGGPYSGWESLGVPGGLTLLGDPAVANEADGRLDVFARFTDNNLWHIWESVPSGGPWSSWENLLGPLAGEPAVTQNADGRLEVFIKGAVDGGLWHRWQTVVDGAWSGWEALHGTLSSDPIVGLNGIGRLTVSVIGPGAALWNTWQTGLASPTWKPWQNQIGTFIQDQAIGRNGDGRLESFVRQSSGYVWHKWQLKPPVTDFSITVHDQRHQLGGYIFVTGQHFSSRGRVRIQFEGIANHQGPYSGGYLDAQADGSFSSYVFDATCDAATRGLVTVRAIDVASGQSVTGTTDMFECR